MKIEIVNRPFGLQVGLALPKSLNAPTKLGSQVFFLDDRGNAGLALGQGDQSLNSDQLRTIGGQICQAARMGNYKDITIFIEYFKSQEDVSKTVQAIIEGLILGDYQFPDYKTKKDDKPLSIDNVGLIVNNDSKIEETRRRIEEVKIYCQAAFLARDLVNMPASDMSPRDVKNKAQEISQKGKFELEIFDKSALVSMKTGGILGVSSGSKNEPYLLHMVYRGGNKKRIAIVGKGVTFDSGGLSLKPAEAMIDMKSDMAGAADVLSVFSVLNDLKIDCEVHGIIPCVENMISADAVKVGDILKMYDGQTVEVLNTDAEGRLILADALAYAETLDVDQIVDLATLTGACLVALGERVAGLMTDDLELRNDLERAFADQGEAIWPLPLFAAYAEMMKSEIADMANVQSGKFAGAIMGGLFLQRFIKKTPWAHLDIAGPSFNRKSLDSFLPAGATGFGVRGLLQWLTNVSSESRVAKQRQND